LNFRAKIGNINLGAAKRPVITSSYGHVPSEISEKKGASLNWAEIG
jgi:hypothetical protein